MFVSIRLISEDLVDVQFKEQNLIEIVPRVWLEFLEKKKENHDDINKHICYISFAEFWL